MVPVEASVGVWSKPSPEVLKGVVGAGLRAMGLSGEEDDTDYSVLCDVKLTAGELVGIVVAYTQDTDYLESYAECILDFVEQQVYVRLFYDGEYVAVYNRSYTLVLGTAYKVKVTLRTETDGSGTLIFSVDGVVQARIELLTALFAAGLYGFSVEGALAADYAEFTGIQYLIEAFYGSLDTTKRLCKLSDSDAQDAALRGYLDDATNWIETELKRAGVTLPLPSVPEELERIASYYAAGKFLQRDTADGKTHPYVESAKEDLAAYITANYGQDAGEPGPLIVTRSSHHHW